jgi:hypothetical protein
MQREPPIRTLTPPCSMNPASHMAAGGNGQLYSSLNMRDARGDRPTETPDERLRQLLAVEQRLQDLVKAAKDDAARRIVAARAAGEQRLAAAREAVERADAEQARAERATHIEALSSIEAAHRTTMAALTELSDLRVDELARWAVGYVIDDSGESRR